MNGDKRSETRKTSPGMFVANGETRKSVRNCYTHDLRLFRETMQASTPISETRPKEDLNKENFTMTTITGKVRFKATWQQHYSAPNGSCALLCCCCCWGGACWKVGMEVCWKPAFMGIAPNMGWGCAPIAGCCWYGICGCMPPMGAIPPICPIIGFT